MTPETIGAWVASGLLIPAIVWLFMQASEIKGLKAAVSRQAGEREMTVAISAIHLRITEGFDSVNDRLDRLERQRDAAL